MKRLTCALIIALFAGTTAAQTFVDGAGVLTDGRDGKRYKTSVIGGKRWMGENLNYQTSSGSWCYDNNSSGLQELWWERCMDG